MVCVPCIVIPFLLWFFNRYVKPLVSKFWWPKGNEKLECPFKSKPVDSGGTESENTSNHIKEHNGVANGHTVTAGGDSKKDL